MLFDQNGSEREPLCWGIGCFLLALAFFGGHLYTGDGEAYFSVAWNLLTMNPPTIPEYLVGYGVYGEGGYYFSKFGIGLSILLIPLLMVALVLALLIPGVVLTGSELRAVALLQGPILAGLGCILLYQQTSRMDVSREARSVTLLSFVLGGLWLSYSRTLFSETAVAVLLLFMWNQTYDHSYRSDWLMALAGALSILIRIEMVVVVLPILVVRFYRGGHWTGLAIPPVFSGGLIAGYNYFRFGQFLNTGMGQSEVEGFTTPLPVGLIGQFFAPGNGLFIYAPFLLISVIVTGLVWIRHREDTNLYLVALIVGFFVYLVIHSKWHSWMGGWSWGPRRMIPFLPLFHVTIAYSWDYFQDFLKLLFGVLCLFSMYLNLGGLLTDFNLYYRGRFYREDVLFDVTNAQIIGQNALLWSGEIPLDLFWLRLSPSYGYLVFIGFILTSGYFLMNALRNSGPTGTFKKD